MILWFYDSLTLIKIPMKKWNLQLGINLVLEQPLLGRNPLLIFILCTGCILLKIYTPNHRSWCIVYYSLPVNNPEQIRVLLLVCFSILWWFFSLYCKTTQWWCSWSILPNPVFTWEQQIGPRKTQHYKAQTLYIRLSIDELLLHGVNIKSILVHLGSYKSPSYL